MELKEAVVLITGANRGLGRALVRAAQEAGVGKIYAAARDPAAVDIADVHTLRLDVTADDHIAAAAARCSDVNVLINNAGIARGSAAMAADALDAAHAEFQTNVLGPWKLARAFSPVLAANGGGAIVNVLSVLSWLNLPGGSTYCISKSAAWGLTNALRNELRSQRTSVTAVHVGFMDTDLTASVQAPKVSPDEVARQILRAVAHGQDEVLADVTSRDAKAGLSVHPGIYMRPAA